MTEAWAVVENGQIDVLTVSESRQGAMRNWLYKEHRDFDSLMEQCPDCQVERNFAYKKGETVSVERVGVRVLEAA